MRMDGWKLLTSYAKVFWIGRLWISKKLTFSVTGVPAVPDMGDPFRTSSLPPAGTGTADGSLVP